MANTYFQFKKFTVHQEKAALKVSTDSCLFGAWCASLIQSGVIAPKQILDVGAGSGLLMLMLAQKSNAEIHGIEIDHDSYLQAIENLQSSPWQARMKIVEGDVRSFNFRQTFDLIVSNPPFFEGDLKPLQQQKLISKHAETLTLTALIDAILPFMHAESRFACLLPFHRHDEMIELAAEKGLHLQRSMLVKQTMQHDCFRSMMLFGKKEISSITEDIVILDGNQYTPAFEMLLKDYYLKL